MSTTTTRVTGDGRDCCQTCGRYFYMTRAHVLRPHGPRHDRCAGSGRVGMETRILQAQVLASIAHPLLGQSGLGSSL